MKQIPRWGSKNIRQQC